MEQFKTQEQKKTQQNTKTILPKVQVEKMSPGKEQKFDKLMRQPRSRKYIKAIKDMDILTEDDEAVMQRMREALEEETGEEVDQDYTFDSAEMEAFRQKILENARKSIAEELEKEAKRMEAVLEEKKKPQFILGPCAITGCIVHTLYSLKGEICQHYTPMDVAKEEEVFKKATKLITGRREYSSVEVYNNKMIHRDGAGNTIEIYSLDEE